MEAMAMTSSAVKGEPQAGPAREAEPLMSEVPDLMTGWRASPWQDRSHPSGIGLVYLPLHRDVELLRKSADTNIYLQSMYRISVL